mmetsp:Transcript_52762/g.112628  ORF Transcript_52762/g.112628 Transcript_52762/m.112628 type:complete len:203 (-) Transcript_52762:17-625(-)
MLREVVEAVVQHSQNLGRFVVHDGVFFLVPQNRSCEFAEGVIGEVVQVSQGLAIVQRVGNAGVIALVGAVAGRVGHGRISWRPEHPARVRVFGVIRASSSPGGMHDGVPNHVFQALQEERRERSGGPRTTQCDVEVIAVCLRSKSSTSLHLEAIARVYPREASLLVDLHKGGSSLCHVRSAFDETAKQLVLVCQMRTEAGGL